MASTASAKDLGGAPADAPELDRRTSTLDLTQIGSALDALAIDLNVLMSSALEHGDFDEITRLVEASQAVHLAALALKPDGPMPASAS